MSDETRKLIDVLAAVEAKAQIAEAKANLALGIITRMKIASSKEQENDPNYLYIGTLEEMNIESDLAASIAFKSIIASLRNVSPAEEKQVHDAKAYTEKQREELEMTIRGELMQLFSQSFAR